MGYVTNAKGQTTWETSPGNTVLKDSVFDPGSKNYNAQVANSGGKISLSNLDSSTVSGLSPNYNGIAGSGNPAASGGVGISQPSYGAGQPSIQDSINALKQAQINASIASLGKSRDQSLSNLSAEKATIEPAYQKEKIQAGVTAKQTARSFDEYMAQRGGGAGKSGIGGQGTLLNNMAYQRQYGELGQAEAGAITENARRVTDVGNAYSSDITAANAGIEAQSLQNYITQMNADRLFNQNTEQFNKNYGLQEAGLTGMYGGTQTMAGKSADLSNQLSSAQLKEIQDPNSVTNQMAKIGLDTAQLNYSALPDQLKAQAQKIAQDLALGKISIQAAQTQLDYLPAQMNAEIAAANRSNTGGSGGGSSGPSVTELNYQDKQNSTASTNDAFAVLNNLANQGKSRTEILNYLNQHSSEFVGADYDALLSRAQKAFTWDKKPDGTWYNTYVSKDPNN